MAPSISNNGDVDVAGSATEAAPARHVNCDNGESGHDPTGPGGNPLMWSEAAGGLSIVTSDYDSADESVDHPHPSPCREEGSFSPCSSSADVPGPEQVPFVPAAFGVYDQCDAQQLQFVLQGDNIFMYPPPTFNAPVTQGVMPYAGVPINMMNQMPYTTAAGPSMVYPPAIPAQQQQQFVHPAPVTSQSPVPMMPPQPQGPPLPPPPMNQMPLQQGPPAMNQSPAPGPAMYQTPPPTIPSPNIMGGGADNKKISVATMPMPTPNGEDQEMSVGTRNGPMVLFATAPGASEATIEVPGLSNYPDSVSQQMEIVWHGEFQRNFAVLQPHQWVLKPTDEPPENAKDHWHLFKDSAKVRFMCHNCGNAWTSMKGRCLFWIHLDHNENLGGVLFKLYGQACSKCGSDDEPTFCPAMWYPEEVVKVVGNVFNRVGQLYYGFNTPSLRIDRRSGKPREHHNSKRCQACRDNVCRFEWVFT